MRTRRQHGMSVIKLVVALTSVSLILSGCFGSDETPAPLGEDGQPAASVDPVTGETLPGGGTAESPGVLPEDQPPPEPGEPTTAEFEVLGTGMDPVEERVVPTVLLARSPEEAEAAAARSPAAGPGTFLRDWDDFGDRSVVLILGGTQPDTAHRFELAGIDVIKNGAQLLVSGRIVAGQGGEETFSIPWVVLTVEASAADTVRKCTVSLEGSSAFSNPCR